MTTTAASANPTAHCHVLRAGLPAICCRTRARNSGGAVYRFPATAVTRFCCMIWLTSSRSVSGLQQITPCVITSATVQREGSRCSATTRRSTSRSVKMPATSVPCITISAPSLYWFIFWVADSTVAPGVVE